MRGVTGLDERELLVEFFRPMSRQGPGSLRTLERALSLAGLDRARHLRIADIGCGTGAASIELAGRLDAEIVAVDFLSQFLDELKGRAQAAGVDAAITTLEAAMEELPLDEGEFDAIWSEGAVYNMGFAAGVSAWRRFLKPGGVLVVSEITWLTAERPREIDDFWNGEYPEIDVASAKIAQLEQAGYSPRGYFPLPEADWEEEFYVPLEAQLAVLAERYPDASEVAELIEAQEQEIDLQRTYRDFVSYGVYVAGRL